MCDAQVKGSADYRALPFGGGIAPKVLPEAQRDRRQLEAAAPGAAVLHVRVAVAHCKNIARRPTRAPRQWFQAAISTSTLVATGAWRWRTATRAATNPKSAITPAISNAELNPAVSALLIAAWVGRPSASWFRDTLAATVPMIAMPSEPPSWRPTLSRAEARPDSVGLTAEMAVALVETNAMPRPIASTTSGPNTSAK